MTVTPAHARPSRPSAVHLRAEDLGGLASVGLRTRKLRATLSALGISIGVAAIVAVLGLAASSSAGLLAEIAQLGTNLLTVTNGTSITGQPAELPTTAPRMVGALHGVTAVQYTGALSNVNAYRSPYIPTIQTNALTARAEAAGAYNTLFLGLGAVVLLVGAIGVANIMIISVLERRQEIGLRRALGATRGQIRIQFLSEAILLSLLGGAVGVIVGAISTAFYAHNKGEPTVIPTGAWAGGLGAALAIGAIAGLLPAIRAARLSPTEALWSL
jgi:putative ABC transport system permease protein